MSLHIEERENEGIIILDLKGPLTLAGCGKTPKNPSETCDGRNVLIV